MKVPPVFLEAGIHSCYMGKKGLELVKIYAVVGLHDFIDRFCLVAFPVPDGETFIAIAPELHAVGVIRL